jgi:hypothetical protein
LSPYLSVVVGENEPKGRSRKYHLLYRSNTRVTRTRNLSTLADALFSEIEGLGFPDRNDAIYLNAGVVGVNGTIGLAATDLISFMADLGRVVERSRLTLPLQAFVAADPETGRILPLPRTLELPKDARERIAALAPPNDEPPRLVVDQPRRVDIVFTEFQAAEEEGEPPARPGRSTAFAVAELAALVTNMRQLGLGALEGLATMAQQARRYELRGDRARPMLEAMTSVLRASS